MLSLMCIAREIFFVGKGTCDQDRANQHCPDRGSGVMQPQRTVRAE
ncbi:unnamed protein product [Staurois parvus]|uniref:Uncharacterized protein n=1 Tax=Staurois parvus TaxID=386267 RepID=A0ABN9CWW1_9NEOB|nr:unnamed protein product [Staurois parvus]